MQYNLVPAKSGDGRTLCSCQGNGGPAWPAAEFVTITSRLPEAGDQQWPYDT